MKSSLKTSLVAAAVAQVLGTAAYALPPSTPIDATFYAAGGSAQVNAVYWAATQFLTSIDSYTDAASGADSSSYRALLGRTTKAIGTVAAGKNVLFFYKFNGGSFPNGAQPHIGAGGTLAYPTIASVQGAVAATGAFPTPTFKFTSVTTNTQVPDWGVTDEEIGLFNTTDNLNGAAALTSAQLSAIQQVGIYDNLFGVAVTNTLFAKKTNFSKPEVTGILAGTITNWGQLFDDTGAALPAGAIILLDRGSGSGSKAAGTQYFLTTPGGKATGGSIDPNSVTNAAGAGGAVGTGINSGYTSTVMVPSASTYQDVREASNGAIVADLKTAQAAGLRAVAILGLEFPPAQNQAGGANVYSFAKLNGIGVDTGTTGDNINGAHGGGSATKYTNAVLGSYDFFYQNSFNFRTNLTGDHLAIKNEVLADLQASGIAGANAGLAFPSAVPGVLLDPVAVGTQVAGVVLGSRFGQSTAPLQQAFDAASTGGTVTFGSDPL